MTDEMPSTLIGWGEVYELCRKLVRQLREAEVRFDIIVAIARGGYIPGRIVSDMLGVHDLAGFKVEHYQGIHKEKEALVKYPLNADIDGKNVLLLDDVCDSGDTFVVALEHIRRRGAANEMRTAALHYKTVSRYIPDFYVETVQEWRWIIYPWAVNEDLSSMISKMSIEGSDMALLQRLIKKRHGIDVTRTQIQDAMALIDQPAIREQNRHGWQAAKPGIPHEKE
ncbi:MAG: phosphoribosyltransferase [Gammaproteobacteria bacterium]